MQEKKKKQRDDQNNKQKRPIANSYQAKLKL